MGDRSAIRDRFMMGPGAVSGGQPVIAFEGVHKTFSRQAARTFLRNHVSMWLRRSEADVVHALRDVSFAIQPGESMAVIGPNGAGKTTLLSLVAGIAYPDRGRVTVHGRVSALLELGSGFHPDLTGTENVYLNASIYGLSKKQVKARFDEIVDFSGIGDFIHEPLRTYSSGMAMRLAFSVMVNVDPEVLLIDEALAVGDEEFQAKCIDKILALRRSGKTLLCVSHGTEILKQLCDRAIWLDKGQVMLSGNVLQVVSAYHARRLAAQV